MSLRYRTILTTLGKKYSSELQAVINRANLEGFTLPNESTLNALNTLISSLVSSGIFSKLDYLRISAYNDLNCEDFARINVANPSGDLITYSINGTSSIEYTVDGVKLNSTTSNYAWLITPITISYPITSNNYKRDNASKGMIVYQSGWGTFTSGLSGVNADSAERMAGDSSVSQRIMQATNNLPSTLDLRGIGLKAMTRLSNTVNGLNLNTVNSFISSFDTATRNYGFYCEGRSNTTGSNMGTSLGFLGGYLTDAEVFNLSLYYNNYLSNIGLLNFSTLLPQTQAILDRAILEGFTLPSQNTILSMDRLIYSMLNSGYWAKRDLILNFAYNDDNCREFSMINWKNPSGPLATENNSYYNLFARSEEFDNSWWAKITGTITPNDVLAPDGTLTADRFNITATTARLQIASGQYIPLLGKKYNFSIYVKPDTRFIITLRDQLSTPNGAEFNLSTLTATNTGNGTNATITVEANGFYRCSVDFMPTTTSINVGLGGSPIVAQLWIWGIQLTEGYGVKPYQQTTNTYSALQYEGRGFYGNINWNQSVPNTYNIDTGYNPFTDGVNYTLDNASMDVVTQNNLGSNNYVGSAGGNTVNNNLRIGSAGSTSRINSSGNLFTAVDTNAIGYIALNRIDSVNHKVVINSTILDNTRVSTSIPNDNHFLYSFNSLNQGGLFSYYSMGAEVVTEGQLFRTAYNNYLANISLNPIA